MYRVIILYSFLPAWLKLSWEQRKDIEETVISSLIEKYSSNLALEFCDAEAFNAESSDIILIKADDLIQYYFFIEELRESVLFKDNYVRFDDIKIGLANGYKLFEDSVLSKNS